MQLCRQKTQHISSINFMSWCQINRFTSAWKYRLRSSGLIKAEFFDAKLIYFIGVWRTARRFFMLIGSNEFPSLKSRVTIGQPPVNVFPFVFVNVRGCACFHWLIHGLGFLATDWLKYDPPCSTCLVMRGWKILPAVWSRTALSPPPPQWISCADCRVVQAG